MTSKAFDNVVKLNDWVTVKTFGAVGDGVADDTAALQAAIASQQPLYFGPHTYRITAPILQTVTKNVFWDGAGAKIVYANSSHTEYAIRLNDTAGVQITIADLTIDGTKQCNKILEILNNTSNTTPSTFVSHELRVERAKRLNTFNGGEGILIRGAFNNVTFNGGYVKDCELPAGQGTAQVVGIRGIGVTWYSVTSFVRRLTLNGVLIEKVYSSDLTYLFDQDGLAFFAPDITGGTSGKVESDLVVMGNCRFVNCYGRAIKTQVRNTVVRDSHFIRTEGLTGTNTPEIGAQTGSLVAEANTFSYNDGHAPVNVFAPSTTTGWKAGASIRNNEVYLNATILDIFVEPFPSGVVDPWSRMEVVGNKILGEVRRFVVFLTNAEKAHLTVTDNWVQEIGQSLASATLNERNLIYVQASGGSAPYFAYVFAANNVYAGSQTVHLLRDTVSGTSMRSSLSAHGNFGFVNNWNAEVNDNALPNMAQAIAAKLTGLEASANKGYFGMQTLVLADQAVGVFGFRASNASLVILQVSVSRNAYAIFTVDSSTNSIAAGTEVALGTTTNPGTGDFNIWRSGTGEFSVENDSGTSRVVSAWIFSPN